MADDTASGARRERQRVAQQKYREANRDEILDRRREWRRANRDRINAQRRARRADPEYRRREYEQRKQDRLAHPEKYRERTRKWRAANLEKARESSRKRAPLRESMRTIHGRDWWADYQAFWFAQEGRCYLCGEALPPDAYPNPPGKGPAIDHDHRCCRSGRSCKTCRRGVACQRCNMTVGLFGDNPALLRHVADALEVALRSFEERFRQSPAQEELF